MFDLNKFIDFILADCAGLSDEEKNDKTNLYIQNELETIMKRTPTEEEVTAVWIKIETILENSLFENG